MSFWKKHFTNWKHQHFRVRGMSLLMFRYGYCKATREDPLNRVHAHSLVFRFLLQYHSITWGHRYSSPAAKLKQQQSDWNRAVHARRGQQLLGRRHG
ncbi:hypothetical protein LCGC14_2262480 [marine sediment metagenome]|uniref:Uncharacterized protein n=1 Tax=marine sediment metagenome TaxID=412755 RepID=A0A0F9CZ99_9ZZZZ